MARQTGIIKIKGTLGGVTFYQANGLDLARKKSSLNRKAVLKGANFERTRENASEFAQGATFMKAVRKSVGEIFVGNANYVARMNALIYRLLESETLHDRGKRLCSYSGALGLLQGFKCMDNDRLDFLLGFLFYDTSNHAMSGIYTWEVANLDCGAVVFPPNATHFRIVAGFGQVHQDSLEKVSYPTFVGPYLSSVSGLYSEVFSLSGVFAIDSAPYRSFLCVRVQFFQEVGGVYYPIRAGLGCGLVWCR